MTMSSCLAVGQREDGADQARPLVVVIAGPTGVGKSEIAAQLCERLDSKEGGRYRGGLIISADSVQAYRGVQIGANKPSAAELERTPHLLVDVADSHDAYNAAEWNRDALAAIHVLSHSIVDKSRTSDNGRLTDTNFTGDTTNAERLETIRNWVRQVRIQKRYSDDTPLLPLVVGGTMMYLQWLVHGRPDAMKPSDSALETAQRLMDGHRNQDDWTAAVTLVSSYGPVFAERTTKLCGKDWYRLRRILEVALTASEGSLVPNLDEGFDLKEMQAPSFYQGQRNGGLQSLGFDVRSIFLCPDDRMKHTSVIDERCERMIQNGLLRETTDLVLTGTLPDMAAKAIGYRQTLEYLQRDNPLDGDAESFQHFVDQFTTATRRYAKKQMQWFRKDEQFVFVQVPLSENRDERVKIALDEIVRLLSLSRAEYDKERLDATSKSAASRRNNEAQGKGMRTYQFKRHVLIPESKEARQSLLEADACTQQLQAKRPRQIEHPPLG
jgi:tRNA dimethylallyltransferase